MPSSAHLRSFGGNPAIQVTFSAYGEIPFPQVILHKQGMQKFIKGDAIRLAAESNKEWTYVASVPAGLLRKGVITVQVEGCKKADLIQAGGSDWAKEYRNLHLASTLAIFGEAVG